MKVVRDIRGEIPLFIMQKLSKGDLSMKVVKAGYEEINEKDIFKKVERIARVCYKSEDKIGPGTDMVMINNLISRKHYAMLEHGSLCYRVTRDIYSFVVEMVGERQGEICNLRDVMPISRIRYSRTYDETAEHCAESYIISGNLRAWFEFFQWAAERGIECKQLYELWSTINTDTKGIFNTMPYYQNANSDRAGVTRVKDYSTLLPEERMMHETFSVLFTCDRGVTHELVRMRDCSFAQESTRYCNYTNGKFGNEISVIKPCFFEEGTVEYESWKTAMMYAEIAYNNLISDGAKPQEARSVLPTSVKADIVVTANLIEWKHIFALRACDVTGPAHPQMKEIMVPLFLKKREEYSFAFGDLMMRDEV